MRSTIALCVPLLFAACATTAKPGLDELRPTSTTSSEVVTANAWADVSVDRAEVAALAAPGAFAATQAPGQDDYVVTPLRHKKEGDKSTYTKIKLGAFVPSGDMSDFDTGFWGDLVFARDLMVFLALEGSIGYFQADATGTLGDDKVWGIPVFANARLKLPITIFEIYGGAGLGFIYADYSTPLLSGNDWVWAWDAFLGAEVGLGKLALGLEYKYIQSDKVDGLFAIEGSIGSVYLSLPF